MFAFVVSAVSTAGVVSASAGSTPPNPPHGQGNAFGNGNGNGNSNGMKGRDGMLGRGGIVGRSGNRNGPLHQALVAAFAATTTLSPEEFQAKLDGGMSILQVLREQGFTEEEIRKKIDEAYTAALAAAVTAGDLTEEQAAWLQQKHDQVWENGALPGFDTDVDGEDIDDDEDVGETEDSSRLDSAPVTTTVLHGHAKPAKYWKK